VAAGIDLDDFNYYFKTEDLNRLLKIYSLTRQIKKISLMKFSLIIKEAYFKFCKSLSDNRVFPFILLTDVTHIIKGYLF